MKLNPFNKHFSGDTCEQVQLQLADDGSKFSSVHNASHLLTCAKCRSFRSGIRSDSRAIRSLTPQPALIIWLKTVFSGGGNGTGGGGTLIGGSLGRRVALGSTWILLVASVSFVALQSTHNSLDATSKSASVTTNHGQNLPDGLKEIVSESEPSKKHTSHESSSDRKKSSATADVSRTSEKNSNNSSNRSTANTNSSSNSSDSKTNRQTSNKRHSSGGSNRSGGSGSGGSSDSGSGGSGSSSTSSGGSSSSGDSGSVSGGSGDSGSTSSGSSGSGGSSSGGADTGTTGGTDSSSDSNDRGKGTEPSSGGFTP